MTLAIGGTGVALAAANAAPGGSGPADTQEQDPSYTGSVPAPRTPPRRRTAPRAGTTARPRPMRPPGWSRWPRSHPRGPPPPRWPWCPAPPVPRTRQRERLRRLQRDGHPHRWHDRRREDRRRRRLCARAGDRRGCRGPRRLRTAPTRLPRRRATISSASGSSRPGRSARDAGCALAPARVFVNNPPAAETPAASPTCSDSGDPRLRLLKELLGRLEPGSHVVDLGVAQESRALPSSPSTTRS